MIFDDASVRRVEGADDVAVETRLEFAAVLSTFFGSSWAKAGGIEKLTHAIVTAAEQRKGARRRNNLFFINSFAKKVSRARGPCVNSDVKFSSTILSFVSRLRRALSCCLRPGCPDLRRRA